MKIPLKNRVFTPLFRQYFEMSIMCRILSTGINDAALLPGLY
mgnify:CR=1 FL=1